MTTPYLNVVSTWLMKQWIDVFVQRQKLNALEQVEQVQFTHIEMLHILEDRKTNKQTKTLG